MYDADEHVNWEVTLEVTLFGLGTFVASVLMTFLGPILIPFVPRLPILDLVYQPDWFVPLFITASVAEIAAIVVLIVGKAVFPGKFSASVLWAVGRIETVLAAPFIGCWLVLLVLLAVVA